MRRCTDQLGVALGAVVDVQKEFSDVKRETQQLVQCSEDYLCTYVCTYVRMYRMYIRTYMPTYVHAHVQFVCTQGDTYLMAPLTWCCVLQVMTLLM